MKYRIYGKRLLAATLSASLSLCLFIGCGNASSDAGSNKTEEDLTGADSGDEADADKGNDADTGAGSVLISADIAKQTYFAELPTETEKSSIYIEKIDGLSGDFIRGMDISSLLSEEAGGVKYYDADGNEEDLMKILADAGVNCVRVRVWNDPYDADGNGYGGGNCTADTAAEIGRRAAEYGIKLCVDFHYSDFWADPNKQFAPKAWEDMDLSAKCDAISTYTHDSLVKIINAGADLYMVQIGNEINTGMAGETDFDDITELLKSASSAVREVNEEWNEYSAADRDILVAVHYTNIDNPDGTVEVAQRYCEAGLDYDVFGVSYYPYWHGTFENMTNVLKTIHDTYGVDTCVMETAYMYTTEDGDGSANSASEADELEDYPIGIQGQANAVRDVIAAANDAGALGVFYWEGAWIPVNVELAKAQDTSGKLADASEMSDIWEACGAGWASSYAKEYDPDDAGKYYGGSSWDNQAFFDHDGNVLDSINVFRDIYCGAEGDGLEVEKVKDVELVLSPGDELVMPETVEAIYNDTSCEDPLAVNWDEADLKLIDTDTAGEYEVKGTVNGLEDYVYAYITIADINYVENPGFEDEDTSMWTVESMTDEDPTDIQNKAADAHDGSYAFHYWSEKDMEFEMSQTFTVENAGTYKASAFMQGGDFNSDSQIYLFVRINEDDASEYRSDNVTLDGWVNWKEPEINDIEVAAGDRITIGVYTKACAKSWATYDDFVFSKE